MSDEGEEKKEITKGELVDMFMAHGFHRIDGILAVRNGTTLFMDDERPRKLNDLGERITTLARALFAGEGCEDVYDGAYDEKKAIAEMGEAMDEYKKLAPRSTREVIPII